MAVTTTADRRAASDRAGGWVSAPIDELASPILLTPELASVRATCDVSHVAAGGVIFEEGEVLAHVRIVVQGRVKLSRLVRGRRVTVVLVREGGVIGDVSVLTRTPACCGAVALTDVSLLTLSAARFTTMLGQHPDLAARWVVTSASCLASLERRVVELLAGDTHSQVAAVLVHRLGRGRTVNVTQQAIADLLGVQRTSVSRVIQGLGRRGVIRVGYSHIDVLDRSALQSIAFGSPRLGDGR